MLWYIYIIITRAFKCWQLGRVFWCKIVERRQLDSVIPNQVTASKVTCSFLRSLFGFTSTPCFILNGSFSDCGAFVSKLLLFFFFFLDFELDEYIGCLVFQCYFYGTNRWSVSFGFFNRILRRKMLTPRA